MMAGMAAGRRMNKRKSIKKEMSPLFHIKKQVVEKRVGRHHQFVLHTNMRVINQLLMLTKKRVVSSRLIGKGD